MAFQWLLRGATGTVLINWGLPWLRSVFKFLSFLDAAPVTVAYIQKCVRDGLYDGATFYRSDFVIQCGLFGLKRENPHGQWNSFLKETHAKTIMQLFVFDLNR